MYAGKSPQPSDKKNDTLILHRLRTYDHEDPILLINRSNTNIVLYYAIDYKITSIIQLAMSNYLEYF